MRKLIINSCILFACFMLLPLMARATEPSPSELKNNKILIIADSASWKPFSYLDEKGNPHGLLIELWRLYGEKNNVTVEFRLTSLSESQRLVEQGLADVHGGLFWSPKRAEHFNFGSGLLKIDTQLYIARQYLGQEPKLFFRKHPLGVVAGGYEHMYVKKHMPDANIKVFSTYADLMQAANYGVICGFIADLQVANFYLYMADNPNAYLPIKQLHHAIVRLAVAKDNPELLETIEAGFASIPEDDIQRIYRKWMQVETVYPAYLIPGLALLLLLSLSVYTLLLRRSVAQKTAQLQQANQNLLHLAATDGLTGILNRRSFMDKLKKYSKKQHPLGLLMFDIDRFKGINDNFGHATGDQVLTQLVARISPVLPENSIFARIGGEEFCVLLPNVTEKKLRDISTQCHQAMNASKFITESAPLSVSISMGVIFSQGKELDPHKLLKLADKLMYQAKKYGRNRSEFDLYR